MAHSNTGVHTGLLLMHHWWSLPKGYHRFSPWPLVSSVLLELTSFNPFSSHYTENANETFNTRDVNFKKYRSGVVSGTVDKDKPEAKSMDILYQMRVSGAVKNQHLFNLRKILQAAQVWQWWLSWLHSITYWRVGRHSKNCSKRLMKDLAASSTYSKALSLFYVFNREKSGILPSHKNTTVKQNLSHLWDILDNIYIKLLYI